MKGYQIFVAVVLLVLAEVAAELILDRIREAKVIHAQET